MRRSAISPTRGHPPSPWRAGWRISADAMTPPPEFAVKLRPPLPNRREYLRHRLLTRFRPEVPFPVEPKADIACFRVTPADHEHRVDFLLLGPQDLSVDL